MPVVYLSNKNSKEREFKLSTSSRLPKVQNKINNFDTDSRTKINSFLPFKRNYNYLANQLAIGIQTVMQHSFQRILERVLEGIRSWGEGISAHHFHPSYDKSKMEALFQPKTIAVIGASKKESSLGKRLFENLTLLDYKGEVFAVNPKYEEINGSVCYKKIEDIEFIHLK